ncbi:MAG: DinB family protein [Bacteroidota bacterium]|nr:DinB family protein [Bacteroidota bacterium]
MNEKNNHAIVALLSEYERAITELQKVIEDITETELMAIVDRLTANPDCVSIQTILTHVVSAGYSYCISIRNIKDNDAEPPEEMPRSTVAGYKRDLDDVIKFTYDTFAGISDFELEEFDDSKKMLTSWGQRYDTEQIMEHAIVHILRHRRQIEKFKNILRA